MNAEYDGGFTTEVLSDGDVKVTSKHFHEFVFQSSFPFVEHRPVKRMKRIVERAKKRLQKREDRLIEIKEEFKS